MALFEVYIPSPQAGVEPTTLHAQAENWLDALMAGFDHLGDPSATHHASLLCDVKEDGTIHATDPKSGRVFRIVELTSPPPPPPKRGTTQPSVPVSGPIGRPVTSMNVDEVLSDVFDASELCYGKADQEAGVTYMLDLLMEKIPAESGSVILADVNANDLFFGAARGPKADEIKRFRVPMGKGIVGFCTQEGCAIAVSDVSRDPRFYRAIAQQLKYETRSILCAAMQYEGQIVGALELINKRGSDQFTSEELSVAEFVATQTAKYLITTMDQDPEG